MISLRGGSKNVADELRRMAKKYLATIKVLLRYPAVAVRTPGWLLASNIPSDGE